MTVEEKIADLKARRKDHLAMVLTFVGNKDAHGIMDAGAELQALERTIKELEDLL